MHAVKVLHFCASHIYSAIISLTMILIQVFILYSNYTGVDGDSILRTWNSSIMITKEVLQNTIRKL